jgi:hypothetical protein
MTLTRALWALSGAVCIGTAAELTLLGHNETLVQRVPFALCALGLVAAMSGVLSPESRRFPLGSAFVIAIGSLFGIWEHLEHNYQFEAEIRPTATFGTLLSETVTGASPLLAPGGLWVGAALLVLADWSQVKHAKKPLPTTSPTDPI